MNKKHYFILAIAIVGFAAFALWDPLHPIAQLDDNHVLVNMRAMMTGDYRYASGPVINVFGTIPMVMFCPYHVGIDHLAFLPFVKLIGLNYYSVHIAGAVTSIITLLFLFLFLRDFFDKGIALVSVCLPFRTLL